MCYHRDMTERNRLRVLAGLGLALYGVAALLLGSLPTVDDSGADVVAWFGDHGSRVRGSLFLTLFTWPLFAGYVSIVRSWLRGVWRDVYLIGAIAFVVETVVQGWILGALALRPEQLEPATARTLLDVASYWGPMLTGSTVLMLAPLVHAAWRRVPGLARWAGAVVAIALVEQTLETVTVLGRSGFSAPRRHDESRGGGGPGPARLPGRRPRIGPRRPPQPGAHGRRLTDAGYLTGRGRRWAAAAADPS